MTNVHHDDSTMVYRCTGTLYGARVLLVLLTGNDVVTLVPSKLAQFVEGGGELENLSGQHVHVSSCVRGEAGGGTAVCWERERSSKPRDGILLGLWRRYAETNLLAGEALAAAIGQPQECVLSKATLGVITHKLIIILLSW